MNQILIIDDEPKLRTLLSRIIGLEGFSVVEAEDCKTALLKLEKIDVDIILSDVKLPDGNGLDLAKQIKKKSPHIEIILLTAYGNIPDGVQAIKNGAFDYITKGDDNNKIIPLIYRAIEKVSLAKKIVRLEKQLGEKYSFEKIIGKSKAIQSAIDLAKKVSTTDATVLLTGETGTGKEVFTQAIHQASNRCRQSFVAVNCSAFGKDLLESAMFGHRAGAFTGAVKDHKGLFEEANQGTIFLDEIGEMALELQGKLLRVLETGEFLKVGDSKPTRVNVRLIAATNRNLPEEIKNGNFREDLFYRISVFQIPLPSLRDRSSDIEELSYYFLHFFASKMNKRITRFSDDTLLALKLSQWKGNIRELRNTIERAVILCSSDEITLNELSTDLQKTTFSSNKNEPATFDLAYIEKIHIQKVLNYTNGNKTKTAELLGIALTTLYRKITEYGLE